MQRPHWNPSVGFAEIRKARKEHTCIDCHDPIPIGKDFMHSLESGKGRSTCLECASKISETCHEFALAFDIRYDIPEGPDGS